MVLTMEKIIPLALVGSLLAWAAGFFGPDKRARALAKARAAKKRYARARRRTRSTGRAGRKLTKAERREIALRNLAKARRARRKKK